MNAQTINSKGRRAYRITSGNRAVVVTKYGSYWHMVHEANRACKNFDSYAAVLRHLESKGW